MRRLPGSSLLVFSVVVLGDPSGALSHGVSGRVVDVRTGGGIGGLPVALGASGDTTDADGRFRVETVGEARLVVDGRSLGFSVYLVEPFRVDADTTVVIRLLPLSPLRSGHYRNLLHFFKLMTGTGEPGRRAIEDVSISYESSPRTTHLRRWDALPIRLHVPPRTAGGFSWDRIVWRAVERWERSVGLDLFEPAGDPDRAQVRVVYSGPYSRVVFEEWAPSGVPLGVTMRLKGDEVEADRLRASAEHELGHVLMLLVHSEDPGHLMYWGGSAGRRVSEDEALVVRCMYGLPNLTDMSVYREKVPVSRRMKERKRMLAIVTIQILLALFVILAAH